MTTTTETTTATGPVPAPAPGIGIKSIDDGTRDGWADYVGRIVLQWRDNIERGPYLLVTGTDDPDAASQQEIDEWTPYEVSSTDWSQRLHVFRVRTPSEILAEGYDDEDVRIALAGEDDEIALHEVDVTGVTVEPEEPPCRKSPHHPERKRHKWVIGQAYGHGGGVQHTDTCKRCGVQRHIDTWAQDPSDGSQGHTSTSYSEPGVSGDDLMVRPGVVA